MSKIENVTIKCPECGAEINYRYYRSINVTLDPELKEMVYDGSIFKLTCSKCGGTITLVPPFLYHDIDKKMMVQLEDYGNLIDFKNNYVDNRKEGFLNDFKIIGVTNLRDMFTVITSFDHDLDYRVVALALRELETQLINYEKEGNVEKIKVVGTFLNGFTDKVGNLTVRFDANVDGRDVTRFSSLTKELYKSYEDKYKARLDEIDPFIFDRQMVDHFYNNLNEDVAYHEEHKTSYYVLKFINGDITIASKVPSFLKGKIKPNTLLIVKDKYNERTIAMVQEIKELNGLSVSMPDGTNVVAIVEEVKINNNQPSKISLDQDDLIKSLVELKNSDYDVNVHLPINKLLTSKMLICGSQNPSIFEDLASIVDDKEECLCCDFHKVVINDEAYLAVYTNYDRIDVNGDVMSTVASFDEIVRIIKNDTRYAGIIINPNAEDIVLDIDSLTFYLINRSFTSVKSLVDLVSDLTEEEQDYLTHKLFEVFLSKFCDDNRKVELMEKYNLTENEYEIACGEAYMLLNDIIYARF